MAGGAPRKWKSVKAMQEAIDAYFESCKGTPLRIDGDVAKYGLPQYCPCTLSALGFGADGWT